jgi:membrane protein
VFGMAMLIYGASCGISELQSALNTVWKVRPGEQPHPERGYWLKQMISLGMVFALALLLLASIVFSTIINAVGDRLHLLFPKAASHAMLQLMQVGSSLTVVTILFALLYKVLPAASIRWRDVWLGALLTGILFVVGKFCLELYLAQRDLSTVYGAAGSFVGILLWINYAALIFLFGAEWTQVWARRRKAKNQAYLVGEQN